MAADRLPEDPRRRKAHNQIVPCRGGQSRRLLSVHQAGGREGRGDGVARRNSEAGGADAGLWLSADHRGAAASGLGGKSQTSAAVDACGQFAVSAEARVCAYYRLGPRTADLSEPGARAEAERLESALGGRYYLHSTAAGVRVFGSDSGCVFTPGDWLGVGPYARGGVGAGRVADGDRARASGARTGASFRSRGAICV